MKPQALLRASSDILEQAQSFPGVLAGIAWLDTLLTSPSYRINNMEDWKSGVACETEEPVERTDDFGSLLVLALHHPPDHPELDWWDGKGTIGNRILMLIAASMTEWLLNFLNIVAIPLPYHIEKGGEYLKDAAVLAGLGVIGKNNLLITPEYGPMVRLRAVRLKAELTPTGPIDWFDPCKSCDQPCRRACPKGALDKGYTVGNCIAQLEKDRSDGYGRVKDDSNTLVQVKYCRLCELACTAVG